jgi:transposase
LGRKNFLFVGHDEAGEHLADLYSLVSTCELNRINPFRYLRDVLVRVQTHPQSRIDELLRRRWAEVFEATAPDLRAARFAVDFYEPVG